MFSIFSNKHGHSTYSLIICTLMSTLHHVLKFINSYKNLLPFTIFLFHFEIVSNLSNSCKNPTKNTQSPFTPDTTIVGMLFYLSQLFLPLFSLSTTLSLSLSLSPFFYLSHSLSLLSQYRYRKNCRSEIYIYLNMMFYHTFVLHT